MQPPPPRYLFVVAAAWYRPDSGEAQFLFPKNSYMEALSGYKEEGFTGHAALVLAATWMESAFSLRPAVQPTIIELRSPVPTIVVLYRLTDEEARRLGGYTWVSARTIRHTSDHGLFLKPVAARLPRQLLLPGRLWRAVTPVSTRHRQ